MQVAEAKILLGLPPYSRPSLSQVKAAYRRKVWETHPDRFPLDQKLQAESQFKLISEAYTLLDSVGKNGQDLRAAAASYSSRVVKTGVPRPQGGQRSSRLASVPFLLIIFSAFTLGGSTAARSYRKQKEAHPSFNPFLP